MTPQTARPEAPSPVSGRASNFPPAVKRAVPMAVRGARREGTSIRCDWPCTRDAVKREDGWWHCAEHLAEHRAEFRSQQPVEQTPEEVLNARLRELYEQGLNDTEIGLGIGRSRDAVGHRRRKLGLPAQGKSGPRELQPCGTPAAARRHYRAGESCATCRRAENSRKRVNAYPESQKRWSA